MPLSCACYRIFFSKSGLPFRSPLDSPEVKALVPAGTVIKRGESKVIRIADTVDLGAPDDTGLSDPYFLLLMADRVTGYAVSC